MTVPVEKLNLPSSVFGLLVRAETSGHRTELIGIQEQRVTLGAARSRKNRPKIGSFRQYFLRAVGMPDPGDSLEPDCFAGENHGPVGVESAAERIGRFDGVGNAVQVNLFRCAEQALAVTRRHPPAPRMNGIGCRLFQFPGHHGESIRSNVGDQGYFGRFRHRVAAFQPDCHGIDGFAAARIGYVKLPETPVAAIGDRNGIEPRETFALVRLEGVIPVRHGRHGNGDRIS